MIVYTCPHCGHTLRIPEQYAGQTGTCAKCKQRFTAPAVDKAPAPAADPAEVQGLAGKLHPPSWQVWVAASTRREAAAALGKTGRKEALSPLLKALDDQEPALSTAAAEALGTLALEAGIETRAAALGTLAIVLEKKQEAGIQERAAGIVAECLGDPEPAIQREAIRSMVRVMMLPAYQEMAPPFLPLFRQALFMQANADPNGDLGREAAQVWGTVWAAHPHWAWTPLSPVERKVAVRALLSVIEHAREAELAERAEKMLVARVGPFGLEWLEEAAQSAPPRLRPIIKRMKDVITGRQNRETFDPDSLGSRSLPAASEERRRMIAESRAKDQQFFEKQKNHAEAERLAAEREKMFEDS